MKTNSTRARLLASSMICGAAALALGGQAYAQVGSPTQPEAAAAGGGQNTPAAVDEVVVTGSRIPRPNLTSTSPLAVVTEQEVKLQGTNTVETLLQTLPSVSAEFNQGVDNGASGTATVSLRGLGSQRTLVLVDGKRLMPGDPFVPTPDVNNIPVALLSRVEVVTGGASAVYGSDAVAGVVNFIMNQNFEGVRLDAQFGVAQHTNNNDTNQAILRAANIDVPSSDAWDGASYNFTGIVGVNAPDGRGNVTAYGSYLHLDPVTQGARDYGACSISTVGANNDQHVCQGSSNSAYGRFFDLGVADNPDGTNTFVPYAPQFAYNFAPYNYYQREDTRWLAGYFAHYEVNKAVDIYSNLMFADDDTVGQAAGSGLFGNNGPIYTVNCANPLAGAGQLELLCGEDAGNPNVLSPGQTIGYRFANIPRETELQHTSYRLVFGSRGDLGHSWKYDVYGQYGRTHFLSTSTGDVSNSRINRALNVVQGPNGPVCQSFLDGTDTNCVPLDIFRALGAGLTPEAFNYLSEPTFVTGNTEEQVASANLTGDLGSYGIKSPWANDGIGLAVGAEYRREHIDRMADAASASGDLSGAGGSSPPINGNFDVTEFYGELRVPLLQDLPFADLLSAELGYRYSDYSSAGIARTYKASLEFAPTKDIRFRGGYNRAVRAPNVLELFAPQNVVLSSNGDPCSGADPSATEAQCANTGVLGGQYGNIPDCPAAQCNIQTGGNPALRPEKADTYTVGVVLTPRFLPRFNLSADYYDIKIKDAIGSIAPTVAISQCLTTGNPLFCNLFHRAPNGSLFSNQGYIVSTNLNAGSIHTKGIDVEANYSISFSDMGMGDWGGLAFNLTGTYTKSFVQEPVSGLGMYDCVGYFGTTCGQPGGRWRHKLRVTYTTPWNLAISGQWRYGSSNKLDLNSNNPFFGGGGINIPIDAKAPAQNYFDLSAQWRVRDSYTLRVGVNNVFDKDPPIFDANIYGIAGTAGFGNGNTFPGVYDTLGRTMFVGITADF